MKNDWIDFYESFADKLLEFKNKRTELISIIKSAFKELKMKYPFTEKDGETDDLCPFTVFGTFNKGISEANRISLIEKYKEKFDVQATTPNNFNGIPTLNNLSAWFFGNKDVRNQNDIDNLWVLFEAALDLSKTKNNMTRSRFIEYYDKVLSQRGVKWNITFGFYWIRPKEYISLDSRNRNYLLKAVNPYSELIEEISSLNNPPEGKVYLAMVNSFKKSFTNSETPHADFIELSMQAYETPFYDALKKAAENPIELDTDNVNYWIYSPGRKSKYWDEFYNKSIMALSFGDIGDLHHYTNKSEITNAIIEERDEEASHKNRTLALWQFCNEMKPGDIIYVKEGRHNLLGRGIVKGEYQYNPYPSISYKHVREVKWTHKGDWVHPGQAVIKTLTKITPYLDYVHTLETIFRDSENGDISSEKEPSTQQFGTYTPEDILNEIFFSEEKYETIVSLLINKKNLILQGPPGVGKTFSAKRIAYSMLNEKDHHRVKMIQFHQSYSYEDFVMGYRPTQEGFELKAGPFYDFCKKAEDDDENDYFFIIDEINRGNLSKIFGELLMLVEQDKRGEYLKLMYKDELFTVPKNVYIIGLMNTADRSLAIIDYALRRRFAFVTLEPEFKSEKFNMILKESNNSRFREVIEIVNQLNDAIGTDENLGEGFKIGHSYFCLFDDVTDERLKAILNYEIIPLLQEYWFDDQEKIKTWSTQLLGVFND